MTFAENNRISHRQLYRQIVLTYTAPFLLCLVGRGKLLGPAGIWGTAAALAVLAFYVIFLVRLAPGFADLRRSSGPIWSRLIGVFFVIYVVLTAAYLLSVLEEIVPGSLLTGVPGRWVSFLAVLACSLGTHRGMQRRGRAAEISGGLLLGGIFLMMVLCLGQARFSYLQEMFFSEDGGGLSFWMSGYGVLCAFSGLGLLPFLLKDVEKQRRAGKPVFWGIATVCGLVAGMLLLLPAVFGWERLKAETYPVLPLLAGADLPGNVLARFDVLWMGFLLYSLLFAIGSLLHYGHQVIRMTRIGSGRVWLSALIYALSVWKVDGMGIGDYYGVFLGYVFVPCLLILQTLVMLAGRSRRKRRIGAAAGLAALFFLSGCAGVEPEKRMFPLALGVDGTQEGFSVTYGMPDLPKATGQEKPEEGQSTSVLSLAGGNLEEIEQKYNRSQEKYLDLGHIQVLILGDRMLDGDKWKLFLNELKSRNSVGEDVYVFRASDAEKVLSWQGGSGTSVGEYLTGLLENRPSGDRKDRAVTLREVYHEEYSRGAMTDLPQIAAEGDSLEIIWPAPV